VLTILKALDEPALLVGRSGIIRFANAPALRLLAYGADALTGCQLAELSADGTEPVSVLLRRFAGAGQATIGALRLRSGDGAVRRYRCVGCRVVGHPEYGEPLIFVRLADASEDRFKALTEKIVALNAQIRRNKLYQAQLRHALAEKEILLRELHHRVKNNLQTLLGMLSLAERHSQTAEAREALRDVRARVESMAVLQRLLYQKDALGSVGAFPFLEELCQAVARAYGRSGLAVEILPTHILLSLDMAAAIGMIVNELLTNAYKHAFAGRGEGRVIVELARVRNGRSDLVLAVEDDGCGFRDGRGEGTGLTLVRGLASQLGGTCTIGNGSGTRCEVRLPERAEEASLPGGE
jgi:two-component sensor histidine kinase